MNEEHSATVWITGASSGIGRALMETVPFDARLSGVSRRTPTKGSSVALDLSLPSSWEQLGLLWHTEAEGFMGDRAVFIHAAATLDPMGSADSVESGAYEKAVLLNSAAPQVLGSLFLSAFGRLGCRCQVAIITSGAARTVYPGWSHYGAGKAAVDQWVRTVGAEQARKGTLGAGRPAEVIAIAPGVVNTPMQEAIRATSDVDFPQRERFVGLHQAGALADPREVAERIWGLLHDGLPTGSVVDLRDLA